MDRGRQPPRSRLAARRAAELLIRGHGPALLATARRYTASPEDAEDAYQRGMEILLTKTPSVVEEELLRWTKTVIKHEAFAIWRSRDRAVPEDEPLERAMSVAPPPDEQVERIERLRQSAEAIRRLKPQEVRCLLLRAEGYSYRQICRITGFTYTKVNRCLTEGRSSFLRQVAGIESGAECDRFAPILSALADGEATAGDLSRVRPHLRSCLACRAALRAYRELPHRAAEVVPVASGAVAEEGPATLWRWTESAVSWLSERVALVGAKAQAAADAAGASKVAAVAASTIAVAGGTAAVRSLEDDRAEAGPPGRSDRVLASAAPPTVLPELPQRSDHPAAEEARPPAPQPATPVEPAPRAAPTPPPAPEPPVPELPPTAPPPETFPSNGTVPVKTSTEDGALPGVDEQERDIDPMTTPIDRSRRRPPPSPERRASGDAPVESGEPTGQAPDAG